MSLLSKWIHGFHRTKGRRSGLPVGSRPWSRLDVERLEARTLLSATPGQEAWALPALESLDVYVHAPSEEVGPFAAESLPPQFFGGGQQAEFHAPPQGGYDLYGARAEFPRTSLIIQTSDGGATQFGANAGGKPAEPWGASLGSPSGGVSKGPLRSQAPPDGVAPLVAGGSISASSLAASFVTATSLQKTETSLSSAATATVAQSDALQATELEATQDAAFESYSPNVRSFASSGTADRDSHDKAARTATSGERDLDGFLNVDDAGIESAGALKERARAERTSLEEVLHQLREGSIRTHQSVDASKPSSVETADEHPSETRGARPHAADEQLANMVWLADANDDGLSSREASASNLLNLSWNDDASVGIYRAFDVADGMPAATVRPASTPTSERTDSRATDPASTPTTPTGTARKSASAVAFGALTLGGLLAALRVKRGVREEPKQVSHRRRQASGGIIATFDRR